MLADSRLHFAPSGSKFVFLLLAGVGSVAQRHSWLISPEVISRDALLGDLVLVFHVELQLLIGILLVGEHLELGLLCLGLGVKRQFRMRALMFLQEG